MEPAAHGNTPDTEDTEGSQDTYLEPLTPTEQLRVRMGVAIAGATMLGVLITAIWTITSPDGANSSKSTRGSNYSDGIWNGTVTWSDSSISNLRFRSHRGRVSNVTITPGPQTCPENKPIKIRTHAKDNTLKSLSKDTSGWELTLDYGTFAYAVGTLDPKGNCPLIGTITAWPRT